jgi:hypothetical protein
MDTSETKHSLELNTLRKRVEKTRLDNVTNQDIRQQCEIQPIAEWILNSKRMIEDRIVRIVTENIPNR